MALSTVILEDNIWSEIDWTVSSILKGSCRICTMVINLIVIRSLTMSFWTYTMVRTLAVAESPTQFTTGPARLTRGSIGKGGSLRNSILLLTSQSKSASWQTSGYRHNFIG